MSEKEKTKETQKSKKVKVKRFNLTTMDYITIGFTVVIVLIMIFILIRTIGNKQGWFEDDSTAKPGTSAAATATPSPTPSLSEVGNTYGNLSADPVVCEIDDRLYFVSAGEDGTPYIYVQVDGETKALLQDNAHCINVVPDPFTFESDEDASGYTVFYLDADGKICTITDGPIYDDKPFMSKTVTKAASDKAGFRSIAVWGEYLYFIDSDGHVGKMSLIEEEYTVLSQETYTTLSVFSTSIFALHEDDGRLYVLSTTKRPDATAAPSETPTASATATATPVPGVDEYEQQLIDVKANHFCIDGSWIYLATDNGVILYSGDGQSQYTVTNRKATYVNVLDGQVFILSAGTLYTGSLEQFLTNEEQAIGPVTTSVGISLAEDAVYVYTDKLMVSKLDSETKQYSALTAVQLP